MIPNELNLFIYKILPFTVKQLQSFCRARIHQRLLSITELSTHGDSPVGHASSPSCTAQNSTARLFPTSKNQMKVPAPRNQRVLSTLSCNTISCHATVKHDDSEDICNSLIHLVLLIQNAAVSLHSLEELLHLSVLKVFLTSLIPISVI